MSEQHERDELAGTFRIASADWVPPLSIEETNALADAVLAAGYRRPRTITTAEELDALRKDSLLTSQFGQGLVMHPDLVGDREFAGNVLPCVVHWEPNA